MSTWIQKNFGDIEHLKVSVSVMSMIASAIGLVIFLALALTH